MSGRLIVDGARGRCGDAPTPARTDREAGASLVEVLVAGAMVASTVAGLAHADQAVAASDAGAEARVVALLAADAALALALVDVGPVLDGEVAAGVLVERREVTAAGPVDVLVTARWVPGGGSGGSCGGGPDVLEVRSVVTPVPDGPRSATRGPVAITTRRAPSALVPGSSGDPPTDPGACGPAGEP